MKTQVLKVDENNIDKGKIREASSIIKSGGLVAFPTETVYGLGADALSARACAKIFEAKARPLDDPLIVHIGQRDDITGLVREIPDVALALIEKFWPGPLTLVLKKSKLVPDIVSAGLDTVAVRMPSNKIALALIREVQMPLAAPSANISGRTSSTDAGHVLEDLDGKIDMVLDGGKTVIGIESTVLDLTEGAPCILRPGAVTLDAIRRLTKALEPCRQDRVGSPGAYPKHYSPNAKVMLVEEGECQAEKIKNLAGEFKEQGYRFGIIALEENRDEYAGFNIKILGPRGDLKACAANLFSILREFDAEGVDIIIAEGVKEEGLGLAIVDRLKKASGKEAAQCPQ